MAAALLPPLPFGASQLRHHRHGWSSPIPAISASPTIVGLTGTGRARHRDTVLGRPAVSVEKGKYSYDVEALIDKLSSLPPRGSIARCLDTFRHRLSLPDFALVFREFARRGDWQRSLRLFKYMQRQPWCRPDEPIHALLIGALAKHGGAPLLEKCVDIFQEMRSHGVPRTALSYIALISAFARHGRHPDAVELLSRMRDEGIAPTAAVYNIILGSAARADLQWPEFLGLFGEMRHDGVRPDLQTYNTLLAAAAARGLPDEAESLLMGMLEAGIAPDAASYVHLVDAFARAHRLPHVGTLLSDMAAAGHLPDASAYNVLMEAHAGAGNASEAIKVLRQMQAAGVEPMAATYSILLGVFGREGLYEDVRELFREMKAGNTVLDATAYNVLIRVFGDGGYFREVVMLFNDMIKEDIEPDMETYEGVLAACGRSGLHEDASAVFKRMTSYGVMPSIAAYTGIVEAYGNAALYEEALVAFNTMHESGSKPTIETCNSLIDSFAHGGLFKEAEGIATRMTDVGIQKNKDSFNGLIEAYCRGGQLEDAVKAYVEMRKSRCIPDERTVEGVLHVYCIAGLVDESEEQFHELRSGGTLPSIIAYCMMLSLYAKNDRWQEALDLLDEMKTTHTSNAHQVIGSMIQGAYDDESNWQMVEYVLDKYNAEGCNFGIRIYNAILDAAWWLGQKALAQRLLNEALKRGLYPELYRWSNLVWSANVHRMSVGGALTAVSMWLNNIHHRLKEGHDLPNLASVVVVRGEMERSTVTRGLPLPKAVYSYLKENQSSSFHFPGWNKGRIISQRSQLKKLQSELPDYSAPERQGPVPLVNSPFPAPGTKIYTAESSDREDDDTFSKESLLTSKTNAELLSL